MIHLHPIRAARHVCEHACFLGASADAWGSFAHAEAAWIVLAGKLGFVAGALAVYLLHIEERHRQTLGAPPIP